MCVKICVFLTKSISASQFFFVLRGFYVIYHIWCLERFDMWLCFPRSCSSFVVFICISCLFMTYRGIHLDLEERKDNKRDKWKKEMETKECLQSGEDITAKKESIWKSEKECWTDEKIRMKGRKKKTKTSEKKSEMWAIHKQTSPRDLRPAHLLLFTSEEIDTLWKRGSWPRDKTAAAPN